MSCVEQLVLKAEAVLNEVNKNKSVTHFWKYCFQEVLFFVNCNIIKFDHSPNFYSGEHKYVFIE